MNGRAKQKGSQGCLFVGVVDMHQLHTVFLAELFNTACSVDNLLLAGVKRVALGAHFNVQRLTAGGTGLEGVAATASYGNFIVVRMNVGFHSVVLNLDAVSREAPIIQEID